MTRPPGSQSGFVPFYRLISIAVLLSLVGALGYWNARRGDALVVYCAHDSVFADGILGDFQKRTGIEVVTRYDTEATKSLSLVELLLREKDAPRCDVFWNNELLGTMDLAERGVLAGYRGTGWERIPAAFKAPDAQWAGFAARFRVHIVNTTKIALDDPRVAALARPDVSGDLSRVAMAKPLYGTTLTHYVLWWNNWGGDQLRSWHERTRQLGLRELNGNGAVKDAVAEGVCDYGFTDTDDFYDAKDAGFPVALKPVRLASGQTICIPNTVALIRGARHEAQARQLIDFLLSADTELALARSKSRQVPLGPVADELLPEEVRAMKPWVTEGVALAPLAKVRAECLEWLKTQ
jgi:iron(III) transport system substrate-binding protein